jgi:DNA-binding response OmpR family regulator
LIIAGTNSLNAGLRTVLQDSGWQVDSALSNVSALAAVEARPYDIVITSDQTSGEEDLGLLRHLRRVRPHLRMIILTGSSTRDDVISAMRDHAFSYFTEPFSLAALAASVENAMSSPAWDDGIELIAANSNWIRLFARCDLGTADRLTHFIFEITDDLSEEERTSVSTAFHELLLNAMEHGGKFDLAEYVEISYLRSSRAVSCRIKDPGRGFSLNEVRHAAVMNPPEDPLRHLTYREAQNMRAGGYGILLARHLIDEMIYSETGNDVILIKYIDRNHRSSIA